jgi:hypothetical protein
MATGKRKYIYRYHFTIVIKGIVDLTNDQSSFKSLNIQTAELITLKHIQRKDDYYQKHICPYLGSLGHYKLCGDISYHIYSIYAYIPAA